VQVDPLAALAGLEYVMVMTSFEPAALETP
jgi:hypothetical protein